MSGVHLLAPIYLATDPTFTILQSSVALATNKHLLGIVNANSTHIIELVGLYLRNRQTTAVTGVLTEFALKRGTGITTGTNITANVKKFRNSQALPANITLYGSTAAITLTAEDPIAFREWYWTTDEIGAADTSKVSSNNLAFQNLFNPIQMMPPASPITLENGDALTVKCVTNTPGTISVRLDFLVRQIS